MTKLRTIQNISSLEELDGYEAEARRREIGREELEAIYRRRKELTKNRRKGRAGHGRS